MYVSTPFSRPPNPRTVRDVCPIQSPLDVRARIAPERVPTTSIADYVPYRVRCRIARERVLTIVRRQLTCRSGAPIAPHANPESAGSIDHQYFAILAPNPPWPLLKSSTSHLSPLTSHLSPLTSHPSPLTSHLSRLQTRWNLAPNTRSPVSAPWAYNNPILAWPARATLP